MKFGLFFEWPNPEFREFKDIFSEGLEQIKLSESLGFDYVLIAEHHFSNYGFSPAPLLQALKIAENTAKRPFQRDKPPDRPIGASSGPIGGGHQKRER